MSIFLNNLYFCMSLYICISLHVYMSVCLSICLNVYAVYVSTCHCSSISPYVSPCVYAVRRYPLSVCMSVLYTSLYVCKSLYVWFSMECVSLHIYVCLYFPFLAICLCSNAVLSTCLANLVPPHAVEFQSRIVQQHEVMSDSHWSNWWRMAEGVF